MRNLLLLSAAFAVLGVGVVPASADRLCEGAVSAKACASHRAYLASKPFYGEERDKSSPTIKNFDPRYNQALRDAGSGGSGF